VSSLDRRRFLQTSAALSGSLLATGIGRPSCAATRIEVPAVDRIVVQEVTDGAHDVFLRGSEQPGLTVQRTAPNAVQGRTLHSEWGLALHIESQKGGEARRYLLDFGFTPETYANNIEIIRSILAGSMR
jgi:7,8-dihydropterin-6-yl-methyl-4-(beta-D-ribofuranosyl)aminobenzene 5'-phosphate synthase